MSENSICQTPLWLTNSYLEDVLRKYLNDKKVKIHKVEIKPATANGENYVSVMSRIKVSYLSAIDNYKTLQELSFILKYSYESDPYVSNIMTSYDIYNTEMKMYEKILPQLVDLLKQAGDDEQLFAKTFKVDYEKSAIIFEDLRATNYVLADRLKGLDEYHSCMAVKKLAKFHAAAVVLNKRLNGELEKFDRGIFNCRTREFGCIYENLTEACANFAADSPDLGPYYYDKLIKLKPYVVEYATRAYNSNPNHFHTLNHGDLWVNNMMMRYNFSVNGTKSLKDILFIDYQFCNWSSPAVDLYYFYNTSLEPKLQLDIHAIDKLVQYYHRILSDLLRKLNYEGYIPTLHELQMQLDEGKFLAVTATLANQPFMINDQCDDADIRCLLDDDERARNFRKTLYNNKRVQNNIKTLLPYFDRHGLLDVQK